MNLVIYGTGKMAEYICFCMMNDSPYQVIAFCVDDAYLPSAGSELMGIPIMGFKEIIRENPPEETLFHIAIGRNSARKAIFDKVRDAGYDCASYISSKAGVWHDLIIGSNVFIDQCYDIQPFVRIGDNCMVIGARIGHHCTIEDHVLLSGNTLAGNVTIGQGSFLGINSAVKEDVTVGAYNIIGASVFISKNTPNCTMTSSPKDLFRTGDSSRFTLFNKTPEQS
jgi:sugar O-acyltransferase (sialic acid O-acetyltransferase NeuD family)